MSSKAMSRTMLQRSNRSKLRCNNYSVVLKLQMHIALASFMKLWNHSWTNRRESLPVVR
ncbi:hypothetical protein A2U01_0069374 [Trifolium medium]|uniref:Uncharacterized protein n=1 Tax=Trifolium medium TaxID=97028 RepID=A0A392SGY7_9FABA|nr:hypothetical protein [Trifolium medium]